MYKITSWKRSFATVGYFLHTKKQVSIWKLVNQLYNTRSLGNKNTHEVYKQNNCISCLDQNPNLNKIYRKVKVQNKPTKKHSEKFQTLKPETRITKQNKSVKKMWESEKIYHRPPKSEIQ
jgi:hypothetical protein